VRGRDDIGVSVHAHFASGGGINLWHVDIGENSSLQELHNIKRRAQDLRILTEKNRLRDGDDIIRGGGGEGVVFVEGREDEEFTLDEVRGGGEEGARGLFSEDEFGGANVGGGVR
jgi:hypothetical protein